MSTSTASARRTPTAAGAHVLVPVAEGDRLGLGDVPVQGALTPAIEWIQPEETGTPPGRAVVRGRSRTAYGYTARYVPYNPD